jgi:hypothetical protein
MGARDSNPHRQTTEGRRCLWLFLVAFVALTVSPAAVHGQIVGNLEANIPFAFHAGNTKLPPGTYRIHMLDNTDLTVMEITSADGSMSALFEVESAQAKTKPVKSELIFSRYGNHYFLSKLFDQDDSDGSRVAKSRYEKQLIGEAAEIKVVQEHVPAHHAGA